MLKVKFKKFIDDFGVDTFKFVKTNEEYDILYIYYTPRNIINSITFVYLCNDTIKFIQIEASLYNTDLYSHLIGSTEYWYRTVQIHYIFNEDVKNNINITLKESNIMISMYSKTITIQQCDSLFDTYIKYHYSEKMYNIMRKSLKKEVDKYQKR